MRHVRFLAAIIVMMLVPMLLHTLVVTSIPPIKSDIGLIAGNVLDSDVKGGAAFPM